MCDYDAVMLIIRLEDKVAYQVLELGALKTELNTGNVLVKPRVIHAPNSFHYVFKQIRRTFSDS
jgi:hypothetical protein